MVILAVPDYQDLARFDEFFRALLGWEGLGFQLSTFKAENSPVFCRGRRPIGRACFKRFDIIAMRALRVHLSKSPPFATAITSSTTIKVSKAAERDKKAVSGSRPLLDRKNMILQKLHSFLIFSCW